MNAPYFSIIIPTYNRAHLIENTLNSCLLQNVNLDYEIIIIDDGSTDQTSQKIKELNYPNIRYFSITNRERGAARNYGTRKSNGRYITFLDSDDILHPNHLSNAFKLFQESNEPEIIHLGYQLISTDKKVLQTFNTVPYKDLNKAILKGNYMSCMGVFLRRDVALTNPFSENRELSGTEDWLLWLKLAARYKIKFVEEISASMIDHDGRSIKNYSSKELDARTSILIDELKNDKAFISTYGIRSLKKIHAHMLTYSGLHLMLSRKKKDAWRRFINGILIYPGELFSRRTLAIFKHSLK